MNIIKQESCLEKYVYCSNDESKIKTPVKNALFLFITKLAQVFLLCFKANKRLEGPKTEPRSKRENTRI